jgi:DNA-binding HxlR family transcriptional regulator
VKEDEVRERLLVALPTLRHPTFAVLQAQLPPRVKRGVLDRTLRHMVQNGEAVRTRLAGPHGTTTHYRLTHAGLTERARTLLARRAANATS